MITRPVVVAAIPTATGSAPMSRRPRKDVPAQGVPRPTVSVCRGCCCGTGKIPGVDHAGQLARLRTGLAGTATVRAVECLDACEQGNVIVVQPSAEGRRAGGGRSGWAWSTTSTPSRTS